MSDIEIAQKATMKPVLEIGASLGIGAEHLEPYGHYKAKISLKYLDSLPKKSDSKLVLVTAISPTPAGEGKTTTTVGLGDALRHIGKNALIALREPSLGPVFGMKGGAAGGGYAQVVNTGTYDLTITVNGCTNASTLNAAVNSAPVLPVASSGLPDADPIEPPVGRARLRDRERLRGSA